MITPSSSSHPPRNGTTTIRTTGSSPVPNDTTTTTATMIMIILPQDCRRNFGGGGDDHATVSVTIVMGGVNLGSIMFGGFWEHPMYIYIIYSVYMYIYMLCYVGIDRNGIRYPCGCDGVR